MKSLETKLEQILAEATKVIAKTSVIHDLEIVKSNYLGKKGKLTEILHQLGDVDKDERPKIGQAVNSTKEKIIQLIAERERLLHKDLIEKNLNQEAVDITLPPRGQEHGSLHPITRVQHLFEEFFIRLGFVVVEGPEIENDFYNFTALNIPPHHPARTTQDTFYFADGTMLRSQTSPVQIRAMQEMGAPLRVICPGKVYRRDNDATHAPMFHQIEMLIVGEKVNFANLKWIINKFIKYFFKSEIEYRLRPSYFPFTEPSAEVDVKWQVGSSWRWLELGGCGVVHPNVLRAGNIDPDKYQGLAWGFGIDRLAMIYYGINDIRLLFENDLQFLEQF